MSCIVKNRNNVNIMILNKTETWDDTFYEPHAPFKSAARLAAYYAQVNPQKKRGNASLILNKVLREMVRENILELTSVIVVEASGGTTYEENDQLVQKVYSKLGFRIVAHGKDRNNTIADDATISTLMRSTVYVILRHLRLRLKSCVT